MNYKLSCHDKNAIHTIVLHKTLH